MTTLAALTTMRVGGPAPHVVEATTEAELIDAVRSADEAGRPLMLIGGGSNLVAPDEGFDGDVVLLRHLGITVEDSTTCGGALVRVAAGEVWDDVVQRAVAEEWSGIESLSGIPGRAGATPVQNVGAYGQDVSQTIARVRVWDREARAVRTLTSAELGFGYRSSIIKASMSAGTPRYVVLDVTFQLRDSHLSQAIRYADLAAGLGVELGARVPLADAREAVLEQRRRRGMVHDPEDHDSWSCGSFFTNPVLDAAQWEAFVGTLDGLAAPQYDAGEGLRKTSAAWLIDKAGFGKGYGMPGPAALSTKHTLAITNRGGATAADVLALAREIRDGVRTRFGITLENEPLLWGMTL